MCRSTETNNSCIVPSEETGENKFDVGGGWDLCTREKRDQIKRSIMNVVVDWMVYKIKVITDKSGELPYLQPPPKTRDHIGILLQLVYHP